MSKKTYKKIYNRVTPSVQLISATIAFERISRKATNKFRPLYRKPSLVFISFILCIMVAIPVSANISAIYEFFYWRIQSTVMFFRPIQRSFEYNGIRMEVVSAGIQGDTIEIYVTLQDLMWNCITAFFQPLPISHNPC